MNRLLLALPLVVALLAAAVLGIVLVGNGWASGQPQASSVSAGSASGQAQASSVSNGSANGQSQASSVGNGSANGQPTVSSIGPQNVVCKSLANRQQALTKYAPEAADELPLGCTL